MHNITDRLQLSGGKAGTQKSSFATQLAKILGQDTSLNMQDLEAVFSLADLDGDGELTTLEFISGIMAIGSDVLLFDDSQHMKLAKIHGKMQMKLESADRRTTVCDEVFDPDATHINDGNDMVKRGQVSDESFICRSPSLRRMNTDHSFVSKPQSLSLQRKSPRQSIADLPLQASAPDAVGLFLKKA